jgi:hypothetical protein
LFGTQILAGRDVAYISLQVVEPMPTTAKKALPSFYSGFIERSLFTHITPFLQKALSVEK